MNPQRPVDGLLNFIYRIIGNGIGIAIIIEECLHTKAIKTVEPGLGAKPHVTRLVFEYGVHLTVAQTVSIGKTSKLYRPVCTNCSTGQQLHRQQKHHEDAFQKLS